MKNDTLLEGNVSSQLIKLALPLLAGNILQQMYHTVDALIIGRFLGENAFAAVGVAGTVMNLFIFILTGFCTGLGVVFGQLYGKGDKEKFRQELSLAVFGGMLITLVASLVSITMMNPVLRLIQTPEAIIPQVAAYLNVIIAGMIATYFYNLFAGVLRSVGNTRAATRFLFLAVVLNAIGDYLLVVVFHMGIAGAALATVCAQGVSVLCCVTYFIRTYPDLVFQRQDIGWHKHLLRTSLRYGLASALQESSLYIGKMLVQGAVNTLDTAGIAAFTATTRIEGFTNSFASSGGAAATVFISQNYGAGNHKRAREGMKKALLLTGIVGTVMAVLTSGTAPLTVSLFLKDATPLSLQYGISYLRIIAPLYLLCYLGCIFVAHFRGTGHVLIPIAGTTLQIGLRAIVSYLLVGRLGLSAVALATGCGWSCIIIFQLIMLRITDRKKEKSAA